MNILCKHYPELKDVWRTNLVPYLLPRLFDIQVFRMLCVEEMILKRTSAKYIKGFIIQHKVIYSFSDEKAFVVLVDLYGRTRGRVISEQNGNLNIDSMKAILVHDNDTIYIRIK